MNGWRWSGWVLLALVYLFISLPALLLAIDSFNAAPGFPAPLERLTTHWYADIFAHEEFPSAVVNSTWVGICAALISTAIAVPAAYALVRYRPARSNGIATLFLGPLLVPQIVMGLAILQMANLLSLAVGFSGLIAVHSVFVFPFVFRLVLTSLARFDFAQEEAAASLGAGGWRTLWHVTLPQIRPGLIAGITFAFVMSFVNLPLSLFLTNAETATLPIQMFAYMETRLDPMLAAVGSLVLAGAIAVTILMERVFHLRLAD
jgi:putative spermidine/putrescine transport system permease protein